MYPLGKWPLAPSESYLDEYVSLRGKSHHQFWHKFFEVWWGRYPWRLNDDEEPPADPKMLQDLVHVGGDAGKKAEVEASVRKVSLYVENP